MRRNGYLGGYTGAFSSDLLACVLLCLFIGCARTPVAHQEQLVGSWKGASYQSQFGTTTNTLCFRRNGSFESVIHSQAGQIIAVGTYSTNGRTLTLRIPDAVENPKMVTIRLSADQLAIVDGRDETIYQRADFDCENRP